MYTILLVLLTLFVIGNTIKFAKDTLKNGNKLGGIGTIILIPFLITLPLLIIFLY